MDTLVCDFTSENVYASLDDIVIGFRDLETHEKTLNRLQAHLVKNGIHGSEKKRKFLCRKIEFLGHIVWQEEIVCSPNKRNNLFAQKKKTNVKS
jgi:hypothetical protein